MTRHLALVVCMLLAGFGWKLASPVAAQEGERGITLVCVGRGGDSLTLDEWTAEDVRDFETRTGKSISDIVVHPRTGTCYDPAGLMLGWTPGTRWLCSQDTEGT